MVELGPRRVLVASCCAYALLYWACVRPWMLFWPPPAFALALVLSWHVCFALYLASLAVCAVTPPAWCAVGAYTPPDEPHVLKHWRSVCARVAPSVPWRPPGAPRYCVWCEHWQPPRAQHCLLCKRCVARHDHHSRAWGHCIGSANWRSYVQFLAYGLLCSGSGVAWAMLRLCEMGGFIDVGPTEAHHDLSVSMVGALIAQLTLLSLVLPMFALTLHGLVRGALRNVTASEQREAAVGAFVPARPASAMHSVCAYMEGAVSTWWRPW